MTLLIVGLLVFFGIHSVSMMRTLRQSLIDSVGEMPFKGIYSLISLGGFVLIVVGFGNAPFVEIWQPPGWTRAVAMVLMAPVFILLASMHMPGHIKARTRNPMLIAIKIWASAHLIANGDLASMVLFVSFLTYGVINLIAVKRNNRSSVVDNPQAKFDVIAIIIGLGIYAALLLWLHPYVSGVALVAL